MASVVVVVGAIEMSKARSGRGTAVLPKAGQGVGTVVAAALALPGVWMTTAHAENAPESGVASFKMLHYEDSQPGLKRITVDAPSVYLQVPIASNWSIEGSAVLDNVSGATPRWHTAVSSASTMHESRTAYDVKVTHYRERSTWSLGASHSGEHDYVSNALSADASFSSDDNNTTWNVGLATSSDSIDPVNQLVVGEHKRTAEVLLGVTQALTPVDLVQFNITHSHGSGYYDDPYKMLDRRPRERNQTAVLFRWNHHFEGLGASLRSSYRWYHDDFRINAHALQAEWVQPVNAALTITPLLRLYSQSAAFFYFDPVYDPTLGEPYPAGYDVNRPPKYLSADQRLSAFGAVTWGLKAQYSLAPRWSIDAKVEQYEQRGQWRFGGTGSPGLAPFRATSVQLGVSYRF